MRGRIAVPLLLLALCLATVGACAFAARGQTPTTADRASRTDIDGSWQGTLHLPDRDVGEMLKIAQSPAGELTAMLYSADHGAHPAGFISFRNGVLRWDIQSLNLFYEGEMSADGNAISGMLTQQGYSRLLVFERATPEAANALSVADMEQLLGRLHGDSDRKLVAELHDVRLTQRVNGATLASWEAEFPSSKVKDALMKVADLSAFQSPAAADVIGDPAPARQAQLKILTMAAHYVMATMSHLPDFYASRVTTHFESSFYLFREDVSASRSSPYFPAANMWFGEGTAGLRAAGVYSSTVTYRRGEEVPFGRNSKHKEPATGLTSNGEFGPILVQVLSDAIRNGLEFLRWEKEVSGPAAVFAYKVPATSSHFPVKFVFGGTVHTMLPAYHGEIAVDPQTGAILRLTEIADMAPPHQEVRAAVEVTYAPVTIAGHSYILPVRSVTFSSLPVAVYNRGGLAKGDEADSNTWPIQTYMNDVAFVDYHQFRATVQVIPTGKGEAATAPTGNSQP